ncbi:MAG: orotidine-5'-phosphate decarboxylase [Thermoanaerobaculia bacterium]|nr:orotidine-5'-phosphate decarboxylase [Thermoanaerobaculia bacterium]
MTVSRIAHLAVALDTADWGEFRSWCERFGPRAGVLKVGLEAYLRWGPRAAEVALESGAKLFLDLKLHDIPNTVEGATRSAADLGASYLTVHAGGGSVMMESAATAAEGRLSVLAVTLLTHLDRAELARLDLAGEPQERVTSWAALARSAGCAGVVCSALEVGALRARFARPFTLVTPGIRFEAGFESDTADDDQRRVATPEAALADGADLLVVGRPLTRADEPERVLSRLADAATR